MVFVEMEVCALFGFVEYLPMDKSRFVMNKFKKVRCPLSLEDEGNNQQPRRKSDAMIAWVAPPPGCVLVNTDGTSKGNPRQAGGGGVIRGERGDWLCGFAEKEESGYVA